MARVWHRVRTRIVALPILETENSHTIPSQKVRPLLTHSDFAIEGINIFFPERSRLDLQGVFTG